MNFFFVLMSLLLVNVLAVTEIEYKTIVYKTNCMLGQVQLDPMDLLVVCYTCAETDISKLALLLVTPENARSDANGEYPQYVVDGELALQRKISDYASTMPDLRRINFNFISLSYLGATRRNITEESVRRLLLVAERHPEQLTLDKQETCRLIALFVTIKNPSRRITYCNMVAVDDHHECHLTDDLEREYKYRKLHDGYYDVSESVHHKLT